MEFDLGLKLESTQLTVGEWMEVNKLPSNIVAVVQSVVGILSDEDFGKLLDNLDPINQFLSKVIRAGVAELQAKS